MSVYDIPIDSIDGSDNGLGGLAGNVTLVVNVASKCGLTPQYTGLEKVHEQYADQGFSVLGVPCNQFGEQEPGSPEEIATFCSTTYGVTFPMAEMTSSASGSTCGAKRAITFPSRSTRNFSKFHRMSPSTPSASAVAVSTS